MRIQLFEFNEHPRVPRLIHAFIVESLGLGLRWGRTLDNLAPVFSAFLHECGADHVLDLASGSGEPAALLVEALQRRGIRPPRIVLSDLLPDARSLAAMVHLHPEVLEAAPEPVDATAVPPSLDAPVRLLINCFHHFPPDIARRILADAVAHRRAVFIVESFPRNPLLALPFVPYGFAAMVALPFVRSRDRWGRLLLTWVWPVIHWIGAWDLLVSVFRMHSEAELRAMAEATGGAYRWVYEEVPYALGGRLQVFRGVPV